MGSNKSPKKGKVLRVSEYAWSFIDSHREGHTTREAIDHLINEVIDLTTRLEDLMRAPTYYVLPDALLKSAPEARGAAVVSAVRRRRKPTDVEPIAVKVI